MRYFVILCLLFLHSIYINAQIELNIIKLEKDSFEMFFSNEPYIIMNKKYNITIKTNIIKEDSLYVNLDSSTIYLENNIILEETFNHHIYRIDLLKKTSSGSSKIRSTKVISNIKGVKFVLKIDGKQYFRHAGGKIGPNSEISIEFISDLYDLNEIEIKDPITIIWYKKQKEYTKYYLSNYEFSINYKKLRGAKRFLEEQKRDVFIIFPQVYYNDKPLLPIKKTHRMAVLLYVK